MLVEEERLLDEEGVLLDEGGGVLDELLADEDDSGGSFSLGTAFTRSLGW